jgi:hypothetical protein
VTTAAFLALAGALASAAGAASLGNAELNDGTRAPFSWNPERVEVLDSGMLGMTSGPVYDENGQRTGTFNSVWRRDKDGRWRIVFDIGCPPCAAAPSPTPSPSQ